MARADELKARMTESDRGIDMVVEVMAEGGVRCIKLTWCKVLCKVLITR
jgi:hypothetical protein